MTPTSREASKAVFGVRVLLDPLLCKALGPLRLKDLSEQLGEAPPVRGLERPAFLNDWFKAHVRYPSFRERIRAAASSWKAWK